MKIKTSVSIDQKLLARLKTLAKEQDRSVSYVLEKFIEKRVQESPDTEPARNHLMKVRYSKRRPRIPH